METNPYAAPNAPLDPMVGAPGAPARVGFGARFGAAIIDSIVVALLGLALASTVGSLFPGYLAEVLSHQQAKVNANPAMAKQMEAMASMMQFITRWSAAVALAGLLYGLIEGFFGRALGKLLLGLRIADADGQPAPVPRLLARMAVKQSGTILAFVAMATGTYLLAQLAQIPSWVIVLGFLLVLGKKRQALHDLAAKTAVYRNSDLMAR